MDILRRQMFMYEAPEDGGGAVESVEPVEPVEGVTPEHLGDATAEEQAAWALSQSDWEQTVSYLQQTAPILQAVAQYLPQMQQGFQQQQAPPPDPMPELDPFDPESVQGYIQHQIQTGLQQAIQQNIGPYEGMLGMVAAEQGEALARQELETIKSHIGDFNEDTAFLIAAGSIEQGTDPTEALRTAAQYVKDFEMKIREDEREKYKQSLQKLSEAPDGTPVGSSAGAEVQPVPTGPRRYQEVVERVLARQNPTNAVG